MCWKPGPDIVSYLCLSPAQLQFKEKAFQPGASQSLPLISISQQLFTTLTALTISNTSSAAGFSPSGSAEGLGIASLEPPNLTGACGQGLKGDAEQQP